MNQGEGAELADKLAALGHEVVDESSDADLVVLNTCTVIKETENRMKKTGINFAKVYEYCKNNDQKTLAKKAPVHEVLLNMVIEHVPNPLDAQKIRIPVIWKGDKESEVGKAME